MQISRHDINFPKGLHQYELLSLRLTLIMILKITLVLHSRSSLGCKDFKSQ